jgi:predicted molibdopterin-dependent oxidoreductase YjgC
MKLIVADILTSVLHERFDLSINHIIGNCIAIQIGVAKQIIASDIHNMEGAFEVKLI